MDPESDSVQALQDAIMAVPFFSGPTNTGGGLNLAADQLMNFDRSDDVLFPDVCMTFTDGNANIPTATAPDQTDALPNAVENVKMACKLVFSLLKLIPSI